MFSVLTNTSATAALRALGETQAALAKTQARISSGLRVGDASDGAASWSIGAVMRSEVGTLSAINDGIDLNAGIVSVTRTALTAIISIIQGLQADLVTASTPGIDASKVQDDISARQQQIVDIANSASFNGQNWLVQHKVADVSILETHALSDTFSHIDAESGGYIEYRDEANPPYLDPTKPFPNGYDFTDAVSHAAKAVETDTAGTKKTETTSYGGIDHDQAYTRQGWYKDYLGEYQPYAGEVRTRNSYAPVGMGNYTDTGDVDYRGLENANIPMSLSTEKGVSIVAVDLTQFTLFTNYTGRTTVTETTTDAGGQTIEGSFIFGNRSHRSSAPYASYQVDNGFEENNGALDLNLGGTDASTYRKSMPEDDLALAGKTTVLNFNVDGRDPLHSVGDTGAMLSTVAADLASLTTMASKLGGLANRLQSQKAFNTSLSNAIVSGIGSLLDADMNVESVRLQALQTQQQLSVQSLSIANDEGRLILKLFQ